MARQHSHLCVLKTIAGINNKFSLIDIAMSYHSASASYRAVYKANYFRIMTVNDVGTITFDSAFKTVGTQYNNESLYTRDESISVDNAVLIPVLIYGIKGVIE